MSFSPRISTLGFILSPSKDKVLMVHRTRLGDEQEGKFNGLGGKLEAGENVNESLVREIHEEAGVSALDLELRGTISWTGFGPKAIDCFGFIYLIHRFEGILNQESPEGPLEWVHITDMKKLPMWEGDQYFLPLVFDQDPRLFHGSMQYEGEKVTSWDYRRD